MPRRKSLNDKTHHQRQRHYRHLVLEEKIYRLRKKRRDRLPEDLSSSEAILIEQVEASRRAARFEALELELVNHERAVAGLPPLKSIPPDTPQARKIMRMEREMMSILERL
jgi:hypothetical protein